MDPLFHRALNRQVNRVRLNIAAFRADLGVREIPTRSVEAELTGIDQHQGLTVDEETIGTDEAGVDRVDPCVRLWIDFSALISDHEGASLTDGDAWWSYLYLNGHAFLLLFRGQHIFGSHFPRNEEVHARCWKRSNFTGGSG